MSFKAYPKYKESGVEWLGRVPEHWATPPLYLRYEAVLGKMLDEKRHTKQHSLPYVRNVDVQWDRVNVQDLPEIDIRPDEVDRFTLREGDLLICEGGEVGRTAIWSGELPICAFQKAIHRLRSLSPDEDRRYFFYSMRHAVSTGVFSAEGNPNTIPHLTGEKLRRYRLPSPPHVEQAAIAAFLDHETAKIDALIAEQQRLIELLQEKRQAVISHAVTKGLNPDAPMKDSGIEWLGEVPEHWEVCPLKSAILKIEQGWSPQCESYPAEEGEWGVLKVGCVNGDGFNAEEQKALPREIKPLPEYEVMEGDILASRGNTLELVGQAAFIPKVRERLMLSDLLYRFRPQPERAAGEFLVRALRSGYGRFQIERSATGTSASMKKVSQGGLKNLLIALPPLGEQHAILTSTSTMTDQIDRLSDEARSAISLLQERRSALISAAVTGQIDVRGFSAGGGSEAA